MIKPLSEPCYGNEAVSVVGLGPLSQSLGLRVSNFTHLSGQSKEFSTSLGIT